MYSTQNVSLLYCIIKLKTTLLAHFFYLNQCHYDKYRIYNLIFVPKMCILNNY